MRLFLAALIAVLAIPMIAASPQVPDAFEANRGQWPSDVRFAARTAERTYLLLDDGYLTIENGKTMRTRIAEHSESITLRGGSILPGRINLLRGADPSQWIAGIERYETVHMRDERTSLDIVYSLEDGRLRHTTSSTPERVEITAAVPAWSWITYFGGAKEDDLNALAVDAQGSTYLAGGTLSATLATPGAYRSSFAGPGDAFVAKFDRNGALVYATYLGGGATDLATAIAVDSDGSVYLGGTTNSTDFPRVKAAQPAHAGNLDGFVARLNASGTDLLFSSYLGGFGPDQPRALELDPEGGAIIGGLTSSQNFPLKDSSRVQLGGASDCFLTRYDATGGIRSSVLFGGSLTEQLHSMVRGSDGTLYVAGFTGSADFPITNAAQPVFGGNGDGFIARFNASATALLASTFLGGSGKESLFDIAVDGAGRVHIAGDTLSTDLPLVSPVQATKDDKTSGMLATLAADGRSFTFTSYFGASDTDVFQHIVVDARGDVWAGGFSSSTDFPTLQAMQNTFGGTYDAILVRLSPAHALESSTFLGGANSDVVTAMGTNAGLLVVGGVTRSLNFPVKNAHQPTSAGDNDWWVGAIQIPTVTKRRAVGR
jgi:hypothetical protein